jgi:pyruvate kinase
MEMIRKTKIVATLGPASRELEVLEGMIEAGMDVARINASHADAEAIQGQVELVRKAARNTGKQVGLLLDLKGPKIRVGDIQGGETSLHEGQEFNLTTERVRGDSNRVSVSNPDLPDVLVRDNVVLLDDGAMRLKVVDTTETDVLCLVETGGVLKPRKGVNLPGAKLALSSVTETDVAGLELGLELGVDWVALSFVRSRDDILELREILRERGSDLPIVAKIEKPEALEDIEAVVEEADAVMVARGDLGVETSLVEIPFLQKAIIAVCARLGKPVITATQMLESMTYNPTPTRAEVTDVANAVIDGTDAVMLSGESAVGRYPVETVEIMRRIVEETEAALPYEDWLMERRQWVESGVVEAVCCAACELALQTGASAIVAPTESGFTARQMSRFRPRQPILAPTPNARVARRLSLFWGVYPRLVGVHGSIEDMLATAEEVAREEGLLTRGGTAVVTAGIKPSGERGTPDTNTIHCIKDKG